MATRVKLETKGFSEYLEKIAQAGEDVDAAAARALLEGGTVLVYGMVRRVPVDTGNLRRNLAVDGPFRDGNFHYVLVGIGQKADGDTVRYGTAQEYGSSSMPAHPYIRPALDSDMSKARKAMRKVFEEMELL